jgi:hypothetical protein
VTRALLSTFALAVLLLNCAAAAFAQSRAQLMQGTHAYALSVQKASGATGSVALTAKDADRTVIVVRTNETADGSADLRVGACASRGGHTFVPLNPTRSGTSTTTVRVGIVKLTGGSFSVRLKDASGFAFACANISHVNAAGVP